MKPNAACTLSLAFVGAALLTIGCSGSPEGSSSSGEVAIVPGADLVGRIDFQAITQTPAFQRVRKSSRTRTSGRPRARRSFSRSKTSA